MALFVLREVVKSFAVYSAKITLYRLTLRNFRQGAQGGGGLKKLCMTLMLRKRVESVPSLLTTSLMIGNMEIVDNLVHVFPYGRVWLRER